MLDLVIEQHLAILYLYIKIKIADIILVLLFQLSDLKVVGGYHPNPFFAYQLLYHRF